MTNNTNTNTNRNCRPKVKKILLTGGTGFLGQHLIPLLAPQVEKIFLIVREVSVEKARTRFAQFSNIEYILGDITHPQVMFSISDIRKVGQECDTLLHLAAFYDLQGAYAKSYLQNVVGTQNLLFMAKEYFHLQSLHYISTVAVAGDFEGPYFEGDLDLNQNFSNYYAKTKFHAEELVRKWQPIHSPEQQVIKRIYRPGIIIGDSETGEMGKIDGPYYFFRALAAIYNNCPKALLSKGGQEKWTELPLPLPLRAESIFPLIPVDLVAKWVAFMLLNPVQEEPVGASRCYHLYDSTSPSMKEFVEDCLLAFELPLKVLPLPESSLNKYLFEKLLDMPSELLSYSYSRCQFDQSCLQTDFPQFKKEKIYQDYKGIIFDYAKKMFKP